MTGKAEPVNSADQAVELMEMIDGIYASSDLGRRSADPSRLEKFALLIHLGKALPTNPFKRAKPMNKLILSPILPALTLFLASCATVEKEEPASATTTTTTHETVTRVPPPATTTTTVHSTGGY